MIHAQEVEVIDASAPVMEFEKLTHDFGDMEQNDDATCVFKFTNTGKKPLIIENVRASCGCTVPSWTKNPIKKKKSDGITVKFDTRTIRTFNKSITVYSNARNSPVRLNITGTVNRPKIKKSEVHIKRKVLNKPKTKINN